MPLVSYKRNAPEAEEGKEPEPPSPPNSHLAAQKSKVKTTNSFIFPLFTIFFFFFFFFFKFTPNNSIKIHSYKSKLQKEKASILVDEEPKSLEHTLHQYLAQPSFKF
jgi:hypothetical protein